MAWAGGKNRRDKPSHYKAIMSKKKKKNKQSKKQNNNNNISAIYGDNRRRSSSYTGFNQSIYSKYNERYSDKWQIYSSSAFAQALVDRKVNDSIRNGINFTSSDATDLNIDFRKSNLLDLIKRATIESRIFGGAAIVIVEPDKSLTDEFIPELVTPESQIIYHVFNSEIVNLGGDVQYNILDPELINSEFYYIQFTNSPNASDNNAGIGNKIHRSRIIKFHGSELLSPDLLTSYSRIGNNFLSGNHYLGWGRSIIPPQLYAQIEQFDDVMVKLSKVIKKSNVDIIINKDLSDAGGSDDCDLSRELIESFNRLQDEQDAVFLAGDASYDRKSANLSGYKEVMELMVQYITIQEGYPLTYFLGSPTPGSFLNGGSQDMQAYLAAVADMQNKMRANLDKLLVIWQLQTYGKIYDDLDYEFNPLFQSNPKEKAELDQIVANTLTGLYNNGLVPAKNVLETLKEKTSIHINDKNIKEAEEAENLDNERLKEEEVAQEKAEEQAEND